MAVLTAILIGAAVGVAAFTFGYADGSSCLTDDPAACANCHVMEEQYAAWMKCSHRSVAVCNDCHTSSSFVGNVMKAQSEQRRNSRGGAEHAKT